jgi:hypothetical protein
MISVLRFFAAQGLHALATDQWLAGRWGKRQGQWLADAHGRSACCIPAGMRAAFQLQQFCQLWLQYTAALPAPALAPARAA